LIQALNDLVVRERKLNIEILHHLKELEIRKLHLEMGFSSLFDYCTSALKYSESQAQRRITAMRLIQDIPEVETKIQNGSISLTNASKIQTFLNQSKKDLKPLSLLQKRELIQKLENTSSRECELELLKLSPEPLILKEKERVLSEDYTEIKFTIKKDLKTKMDKVKSLLSHKNPNPSYSELLEMMCDLVIQQKEPKLKKSTDSKSDKTSLATLNNTRTQRKASIPPQVKPRKIPSPVKSRAPYKKLSRYIPAPIKQEVYMRDGGCCSYLNKASGKRCSSKQLLQYDHIKPYSFGGETSAYNLRLLCWNHHQLVTQWVFGPG